MATADSVKAKIQGLIDQSNAATGNTDADLTTAVNSLIAGFGQGGGGFPELVYETTFEVEEAQTSGAATLCTISTGFTAETQWAVDGEMLVAALELTNTAEGYTPNDNDVMRSMQPFFSDQYIAWAASIAVSAKLRNGGYRVNASGVGVYINSRPSLFANVTIGSRLPGGELVAPGIYTFKLYRTGVSHA